MEDRASRASRVIVRRVSGTAAAVADLTASGTLVSAYARAAGAPELLPKHNRHPVSVTFLVYDWAQVDFAVGASPLTTAQAAALTGGAAIQVGGRSLWALTAARACTPPLSSLVITTARRITALLWLLPWLAPLCRCHGPSTPCRSTSTCQRMRA